MYCNFQSVIVALNLSFYIILGYMKSQRTRMQYISSAFD